MSSLSTCSHTRDKRIVGKIEIAENKNLILEEKSKTDEIEEIWDEKRKVLNIFLASSSLQHSLTSLSSSCKKIHVISFSLLKVNGEK